MKHEREVMYVIRLMQIELMLENDKLKDKVREIECRERLRKNSNFIEFPYNRRK